MSGRYGGGGNACVICEKVAYPAETIQYEKKAYHIECFKCSDCGKKMEGPAQAANFDGVLFCKQCFQKGGYHQKQRNVVWTKAENLSPDAASAPSKFGGGGVKCTVCEKTVYAAETVSFEKKPYHGECFKCTTCTKKMTPAGAAVFEEKLYCSKCFDTGGFRAKQAATAQKAGTGTKPASSSGPSKFGGGGTKCYGCNLTVYAAEGISLEKNVPHRLFEMQELLEENYARWCGGQALWRRHRGVLQKVLGRVGTRPSAIERQSRCGSCCEC